MKWKREERYGFVRSRRSDVDGDVMVQRYDFCGDVSDITEYMKVEFKRPFENRHGQLRSSRWWSALVEHRLEHSGDGKETVVGDEGFITEVRVCIGV